MSAKINARPPRNDYSSELLRSGPYNFQAAGPEVNEPRWERRILFFGFMRIGWRLMQRRIIKVEVK